MSAQQSCKGRNHARFPRAIRPRFSRSKLGCLACRIRRKKCDEQKPACKSCKKQRLICSWPNHESDTGHLAGFAWQINLKAGARVSKTLVAATNSRRNPSSRLLVASAEKESPQRHEAAAGAMPLEIGYPGVFIKSQDSPCFTMLLEHYVKITSNTLIGRKTCNNPFLSPTLVLAYSDSLVMHAVLAVSGIHCQHSTQNSDVLMATYKHYGIVLKGLKYALTHWVEGTSYEQTLNLLLVAILMCMYEALGGNENGSMSQHVRAAREFALHLITEEQLKQNSELTGILFEAVAYFATLAYFERRPMLGPSQSEDPILSTFDQIRQYQTFGSYLGCAYRLYELIPAVSQLVLYEKRSISRNDDPNNRDLYENLRRSVASWSAEEEYETTPANYTPAQNAEQMAGMIVQNALLMLLHYCRIEEGQGPGVIMQDIQPLIDDTMSLFELISDEPVSAVVVWPILITGSMMQEESQRQSLAEIMRTHHTNTALGDQIVRLLQWVWEDDNESTFGLTGLEKVAKQHKTHLCIV